MQVFCNLNNIYSLQSYTDMTTNEWKDPPFTYFGEAIDLIQNALPLPKILVVTIQIMDQIHS